MIKQSSLTIFILISSLLIIVGCDKSLGKSNNKVTYDKIVNNTVSNELSNASKKNFPYTLNRQDYLLKACLDYNYEKVGFYKIENSKDFSTLAENYRLEAPSNIRFISDYVEKNANFYNEDYSKMYLSYENFEPPYNAIFARCIDFSKSPKAKVFLDSIPHSQHF